MEHNGLVWKLSDHIVIGGAINNQMYEGYIRAGYVKDGKDQILTRWRPIEDEIYKDSLAFHNGRRYRCSEILFWGNRSLLWRSGNVKQ